MLSKNNNISRLVIDSESTEKIKSTSTSTPKSKSTSTSEFSKSLSDTTKENPCDKENRLKEERKILNP